MGSECDIIILYIHIYLWYLTLFYPSTIGLMGFSWDLPSGCLSRSCGIDGPFSSMSSGELAIEHGDFP